MTTIHVIPSVMPGGKPDELLAKARQAVTDDADHGALCLAALRAAAAVIAVRARPERKGLRITSAWLLLAMVEPQLHEWAAFFAASKLAPPRGIEHFRSEVGRFIAVVERLLELPAQDPLG